MLQKNRRSRLAILARVLAVWFAISVTLAQNACIPLVIGAGAGIGGVAGAKLARDTGVQVNAPVEVRFHPVRDLALAERSGREDTTYANVVAVFGRVRQVRGDTVWVVTSEVRFPTSRITFSRSGSPVATIVQSEGTSVRSMRGGAGYAVVGAGIGFLAATAVVYALLLYAMSTAST